MLNIIAQVFVLGFLTVYGILLLGLAWWSLHSHSRSGTAHRRKSDVVNLLQVHYGVLAINREKERNDTLSLTVFNGAVSTAGPATFSRSDDVRGPKQI